VHTPRSDAFGSGRLTAVGRSFLAGGCFLVVLLATADHAAAADRTADFLRDVKPLLDAHCVRCHGPDDPEGDVSVHGLTAAADAAQLATWKKVFERIEDGSMPPADETQPTAGQRRAATGWIGAALKAGGMAFDEQRSLRSDNGNWVDHDALFSAGPAGESATPSRVWRLSPRGYRELMRRIRDGFKARLPFTGQGGPHFDWDFDRNEDINPPWGLQQQWNFNDYTTAHRVGESEIEAHLRLCQALVNTCDWNRAGHCAAVIAAGRETTSAQAQAAVTEMFAKVLPVPVGDEDRQRYTDFLLARLQDSEPKVAVSQCLIAVLCRPELMYRIEESAAGPRAMIPPPQLARSLAHTLADREPDKPLAEAVAAGRLASREDVRAQVERMLTDPALPKPRIVTFFREYFGHPAATDVFKCQTTLQEHGIPKGYGAIVGDIDAIVKATLASDTEVFKTLLTTDQWFVNFGGAKGYATHRDRTLARKARDADRAAKEGKPFDGEAKQYKIDPPSLQSEGLLHVYGLGKPADFDLTRWAALDRFAMPAGQRMGILTHPTWLVAQSANFDNHPIHRGRWIRERLLGGRIPDVPIGVDAKLPDEPDKPLRERMARTREEFCWKCHRLMDPLGLPFEQFDHFGQYRTDELVVDVEQTAAARAKNPNALRTMRLVGRLDTTGMVEDSGDPRLDGPVKDPYELISRLAASERVEQVFVRHVFRFFLGRNETLADGPCLVAAHRAYRDGGGSMRALLTSLLTSDAFLYRTPGQAPAADPQPTASSATR
jgi:hypothetical protein